MSTTPAQARDTEDFLAVVANLLDSQVELGQPERAALHAVGERLVGMSRFAEAAGVFRLLLACEPRNGFYNRAYGICCENLDRLDEAAWALDRAIEDDPQDAFARVSRAAVRIRQGNRDGALADLRSVNTAAQGVPPVLARRIRAMLKGTAADRS